MFDGTAISLTVPFAATVGLEGTGYDGVTVALMVNQNIHASLLGVINVSDVASGNLILPGQIN